MTIRLSGSHGSWSIPDGDVVIGRGKDCGICVLEARLSRHHACLHVHNHRVEIEDLGSTNGVAVNGDRVQSRRQLNSGDKLVFGPCLMTLTIDHTGRLVGKIEGRAITQADAPAASSASVTQPMLESPATSGKRLNTAIAAAVTHTSGLYSPKSKPVTDTHRPTEWDEATSGLAPNQPDAEPRLSSTETMLPNDLKTPLGVTALDAGPRATPSAPPAAVRQRVNTERSTFIQPDDHRVDTSAELQMNPSALRRAMRHLPMHRLMAGVLDSVLVQVVALLLAVPALVLGYALALQQAHAAIANGLPELRPGDAPVPGVFDLVATLFSARGIDRALALARQLQTLKDAEPFLVLFSGATCAALLFVLTHLVATVAATVIRGAPFWHRNRGLVIVDHRSGRYLGWVRAMLRWTLFWLLCPLAPITAVLAKRGLHDLLCGAEVRPRP